MKTAFIRLAAASLAMASVALFAPAANAGFVYTTPVGATDAAGEPISFTADFTLNNGSITIILSNLEGNITSAGQLLTGISFDVTGASGSGLLGTTRSGLVTTISSGGAYTAGVSDTLTRWTSHESGLAITLSLFSGGTPDRGIIGPDNNGNCNAPTTGLYSHANASIIGDNPSIICSATFTITIPGVTTSSILNDVLFLNGTVPNTTPGIPPPNCPSCGVNDFPVPEPVTLSLFGAGLIGAAATRRRKKRAD